MIKEQIERINRQVFNINTLLVPAVGKSGNTNVCPKCKSRFVRIHAENKSVRLYCTECFFEVHYMVINRNE